MAGLGRAQLVHAAPLLLEPLAQRLYLALLQLRRRRLQVLERQWRELLLGPPHRELELLQLRLDAAQPRGRLLVRVRVRARVGLG